MFQTTNQQQSISNHVIISRCSEMFSRHVLAKKSPCFLLRKYPGITQVFVASPRLQVDELQSAGTGTGILVANSTQVMMDMMAGVV